jgi:hypothetical protein
MQSLTGDCALRAVTMSGAEGARMVTAQDRPRSRLEEAPPMQCPRCKALMKARKHVPLPGRKLTWTTAATNAEQRSCELCHAGAEADCVWKLFPTGCTLHPRGPSVLDGRSGSQAAPPPSRPFVGVPPRIASFTGRSAELDLDTILMRNQPAAVTQVSSRSCGSAGHGRCG